MINAYIVENNTGAITATKLNELLSDITNIIAGGGMTYKGCISPSDLPQAPQEGDTYRISSLEGTVGTLNVEMDDIITYKEGAWVMFADHRETYMQNFTSPDYSKLVEEHRKGHFVYVLRKWMEIGSIYSSFLYRANLSSRGGEDFVSFVAIEPISSNTGIRIVQYELHEGDEAWTEYAHIDYPIPAVINNVTSTSTTDALSANMGKELHDLIQNRIPPLTEEAADGIYVLECIKENGVSTYQWRSRGG